MTVDLNSTDAHCKLLTFVQRGGESMALEDYFETEVGIAVAATAALFSPKARKVLRRGAVYGLAGALMAGDAVVGFAKGVGRGAQQAATSARQAAAEAGQKTQAAAQSAKTPAGASPQTVPVVAEEAKGKGKGAGSSTK
jgi:hypothetical protein